jgi:hypothetical protein
MRLLATAGPTATSLNACASLGRSARQGEARTDQRSEGCCASGKGSCGAWQGELQGGPRGARQLGKARGLDLRAAWKPRAAAALVRPGSSAAFSD